ncbi:rab effector MyRIP isoform X3 [Silurus meridionalis]|uniref:rab effector MyRIP isoform X3 n=1 Tax=Silurus meridionalis TaxID=175797 RepID=UPI001EE9CBBF|nr:rab effector MyRIP isoform X3 [Silurus meridionalis]
MFWHENAAREADITKIREMGCKLDMSNLTEDEAEHVLEVVQRDMQLRKTEEARLSELKQELDQEESRCVLLSRQRGFNERCCIRCCSSFAFFLKPRRRCLDCRYNVCKRCCSYSETDKSWLCSACEKSRLLKTQSLEWFYSNVRRRFKRFGSAKVLKMLYRRHVGDQSSQAEFTEGSIYSESTDDSVYESDSTFYKHIEERSMAESISVALRVAKEAIDEAIAKAEKQTGNQEKLKEASYLRDNKGELIEELTTMIVQTIICRKRDLSEMHTECNLETPDPNSNMCQSAFSLLTNEILAQHDNAEQSSMLCTHGLKRDESPAVANWNQNKDWMENSCASSMLQSPDGNWFALQSTQTARLSLPTKRENLMFSGLEKESGVISAYDEMAYDTESDSDVAWEAARVEIHNRLSSSNLLNDHNATSSCLPIQLPTNNSVNQPQSDSDQTSPVAQIYKPFFPLLKRKVSLEDRHLSSCQCHCAMGITANPEAGESSEDGLEDYRVKRTRRRRKNKRVVTEGKVLKVCSGEMQSLSEPRDYGRKLLNYLLKCQRQSISEMPSDETLNADTPDSVTPDISKSGDLTPDAFTTDVEGRNTGHHVLNAASDQHLKSKLRELASQVSNRVEEPADDRHEGRENGKNNRIREAMCNMEIDVDQEEIKGCEDEIADNRLPDVEDNEIKNKTLSDLENLSTNMNDNLHNEVLQKTLEKHTSVELNSTNITDSEEKINNSEDKENDMTERLQVERNVEQGLKDGSENRGRDYSESETIKKQHSVKNEAHIETEAQSLLEIDSQRETPVESCEEGENTESQESRKLKKDGEHAAEIEKDSVEIVESIKRINTEKQRLTYTQDNDFVEAGDDLAYEIMIKNVDKGLNIMEEETKEHMCSTAYNICDCTEELTKEKIVETQYEQNQMTSDNVTGFCNERMNRDEETQVSDMENQSRESLVEKSDEHSCVAEADPCNDHTLKDVLGCTPSSQEEFLTPEEICKKYSAASLRSITTEVLKVLNATEDLIQGAMGLSPSESCDRPVLPPLQSKRIDEQLCRLEENVYVAASAVFGLEAELGDLEMCARSISGETTEEELSQLEEQVASAAAQVQQSELQVSDIAARIAALKNAGLNVAPQTRFAKPQTIDSSRQHRRRLPAPPVQGNSRSIKLFHG